MPHRFPLLCDGPLNLHQFKTVADRLALIPWHRLRFSLNGTPLIEGGSAMDNQEVRCSGPTAALAFLGGAAA